MSSFVVRLLAAALLSFVIVGVVAERLLTHTIHDAFMAEQLADQQADARSIARAMGEVGKGEYPVDKAQELLELIASRPAVSDVELIDENGRVVAASERGDIGEVEDGLSAEVARNGRAYMGEERESADPSGDLEYIVPIEADHRRFALETDQPRAVLDARISGVRRQALTTGLIGLPCALAALLLRRRSPADAAPRDRAATLAHRRAHGPRQPQRVLRERDPARGARPAPRA